MNWIVCQLGARMHFAVPRILASHGMLSHLFTDLYAPDWLRRWERCGPAPAFFRQVAGRYAPDIPRAKVTAFTFLGLEYAWRRRAGGDLTQLFLETNRRFGQRVCDREWETGAGVYVFNAAGLEILQRARNEGRNAVLEQTIAPSRVEQRLMREERLSFPGWEEERADAGHDYMAREEAEWEAADTIVCGSQFVVDGIAECGGPAGKCVVVPYGVDGVGIVESVEHGAWSGGRGEECWNDKGKVKSGDTRGRPLRVLTVGTVGLRKGTPYLLEAAKRMKGRAQFRLIGSVKTKDVVRRDLDRHLDLRDRVPRAEMADHFAWADVFLLPSLCEGSATVTYEAMAAGLPVVCTPNTGSLVRDGRDGFVVPVRDVVAITECLGKLCEEGLRARMSDAARERAREGTVAAYGARLLKVLAGVA